MSDRHTPPTQFNASCPLGISPIGLHLQWMRFSIELLPKRFFIRPIPCRFMVGPLLRVDSWSSHIFQPIPCRIIVEPHLLPANSSSSYFLIEPLHWSLGWVRYRRTCSIRFSSHFTEVHESRWIAAQIKENLPERINANQCTFRMWKYNFFTFSGSSGLQATLLQSTLLQATLLPTSLFQTTLLQAILLSTSLLHAITEEVVFSELFLKSETIRPNETR